VGISIEDQERVFERFFKADRARDRAKGGSGLGLSIVRKIIDLHKGTIKVESQLGQGAAFTVSLPVE
jgi:signal transduction histidine kinase